MLNNDFLLFIDANKYLDLYRTDSGRKLLAPLGEQAKHIFVTQQVFDEVQRNKVLVASNFLRNKFDSLRKFSTSNLPDHLSDEIIAQRGDILQKIKEIRQSIKGVNNEIDMLMRKTIEQISRSEDEVSRALSEIFANAIHHSSDELQRARSRREIGNPPGKANNAIGDQLSWEQILASFRGKKRLWIISRDSDYGTFYNGKGILNGFLYNELANIEHNPEVYLFADTVEGINHFVDLTGVKAKERLSPEEVEEVEREERSLPYYWLEDELRRTHENIEQLTRSGEFIREMTENAARLSQIGRVNMPGDELHRALENIEQFTRSGEFIREMVENATRLSQIGRIDMPSNDNDDKKGDEGMSE